MAINVSAVVLMTQGDNQLAQMQFQRPSLLPIINAIFLR
jgi:hypothetical protein